MNNNEVVSFIWGVAVLIRDPQVRGKYQDVPFMGFRRLDCVLALTKEAVLRGQAELSAKDLQDLDGQLRLASGIAFYHFTLRPRKVARRYASPRRQPAQLHRRRQPEHARGGLPPFRWTHDCLS